MKQACQYCAVFLQYPAITLRSARLLRIEYNASRASPQKSHMTRMRVTHYSTAHDELDSHIAFQEKPSLVGAIAVTRSLHSSVF